MRVTKGRNLNNTSKPGKIFGSSIWEILIKILSIIGVVVGVLTYIHVQIDPIKFVISLLIIVIGVLIIVHISPIISELHEKRKRIEEEKHKIKDYLESLRKHLEMKRTDKGFIDKLSQNIYIKRWKGQFTGCGKETKSILKILEEQYKNDTKVAIAIIGSGGSGKSFTLWKWCIDICKELEETLTNGEILIGKIPVYIPLKDLGDYKTGTLEDYIKMIKLGKIENSYFDLLESNGRLLFIFDGFNEIGLQFHGTEDNRKEHFENTLKDLKEYWKKLQKYGCLIVVSSRDTTSRLDNILSFFQNLDFFHIYKVDTLSNKDIQEILENHFQKDSKRLIALLEDKIGYDFVRNAMHLKMVIEELPNISEKNEKNLPVTLQQIYDNTILKTIEENLDTIKRKQIEVIKEILEEIAYNIIKEEESGKSFQKSLIENKLYPGIKFEHVISCGFLEKVEDPKKTEEEFRFSQNWNEVLAALRIKRMPNLENEIENMVKEQKWHNVLIYLSKILDESDHLIKIALNNENFILASKIIKNASIVKNKEIIFTFLLDLTNKLNHVRLLTCKERLDNPRYKEILHTFFDVVEILGDKALSPFLDMCTKNDDSLIRAQGIYFIEESENLKLKLENEHIFLLSQHLVKEKNIHVIFHILVVLENFLNNDNISKQIKENLLLWDNDLILLQAKLILHRNKLLPYAEENFITQLGKNKEEALKLITDLKKYEILQIEERNDNFIEILDKLEISMWITAELAKEKMINLDDALELFSKALDEKCSPFWIVRWWAIFNLKKFETNKAKRLLLDNITNPLIDLGLLSIKSLAEAGGEEYLKSFVDKAGDPQSGSDLFILVREANSAIDMLMVQKNKKSK